MFADGRHCYGKLFLTSRRMRRLAHFVLDADSPTAGRGIRIQYKMACELPQAVKSRESRSLNNYWCGRRRSRGSST